jgi:hypothetical protein
MTPTGIPISVLLLVSILGAASWADSPEIAAAPPAQASPAASRSAAAPVPASAKPVDPAKRRFQRPAPLKRLVFSAREGFSLKMVSNQDVTAEIRNGAGRTLARAAYTLQAGDWTLRPRNLAPGLYTVLLRTGSQLRSMRMKIEGSERGEGSPEWVLEKARDTHNAIDPAAQRGASVHPAPD